MPDDLLFLANVCAALNHIPMGGHAWGPSYLRIRTPVQVVIALWAYWFVVRSRASVSRFKRMPTPEQIPL